jgi:phenylacetate-CoA ligase
VPHYTKAFDAAGVKPDDLRTLEDLAQFPTTSKADLRANYPFGMFAVPRAEVVRVHASSGTTGKPTVVGYTRKDIDTWATVMARSIRAAGGRAGDIVHVAYGYGLFTGGLGAHYGAEKLGCTVIPMSGGQTEKQVQLILDFKPDIIMVTPSYMLAIAEEIERQGPRPALDVAVDRHLRRGAVDAGDAHRDRAEARHGRRRHLRAVRGHRPGVGCECVEAKDGLSIWEDHFYPEIIDPETGKVLPDGEKGELVFTSLTKEAMPVVRYRTRDLTRLLPPTARSMRRIEKITGRSDDMLKVRGVMVFPTQVEELILKQRELVPQYQIELERPKIMDEMTVVVERSPAVGSADGDRAGATLQHHIKSLIGVSCRVRVVAPGGIERSVGRRSG